MKKISKGLIGFCMVCLLAGCGSEAADNQGDTKETVTPEVSVEATQTPDPTATPEPTATPKPTATPVVGPSYDEVYWQSVLDEFAGVLPFDDKVSPEVIKREFGLSKAAFKRAVGHLMKEGKVEIRDRRIFRLGENE